MIAADRLTKSYGLKTAIRDVSFFIAKGEIVGLLGPNGAGKTTVLRILTCFMQPGTGLLEDLPKSKDEFRQKEPE